MDPLVCKYMLKCCGVNIYDPLICVLQWIQWQLLIHHLILMLIMACEYIYYIFNLMLFCHVCWMFLVIFVVLPLFLWHCHMFKTKHVVSSSALESCLKTRKAGWNKLIFCRVNVWIKTIVYCDCSLSIGSILKHIFCDKKVDIEWISKHTCDCLL